MEIVPTLMSICLDAITDKLLYGDDDDDNDDGGVGVLDGVFDLPSELFDSVMQRLPALALHNLQLLKPEARRNDDDFVCDFSSGPGKRLRFGKFNLAWMLLFRSRWPEVFDQSKTINVSRRNNIVEHKSAHDWRQKYWEMHLQNCFDSAAERGMLPSFRGSILDIAISETLSKAIYLEKGKNVQDLQQKYSQLYVHCQLFGSYVRYLRLQNVFCTSEACQLLQNSNLQGLVVRGIFNLMQVAGLCRILEQNHGTLTRVELVNCKISFSLINVICDSLCNRDSQPHRVQQFVLKGTKLINGNITSLPPKLALFLSSGRLLSDLSICESHMKPNFAKLIFKTLLDATSNIFSLDFSENNISGWLSGFSSSPLDGPQFSPEISKSKSLQSLCVLKLRGNNLCKADMVDLKSAIIHMPRLDTLDLSDNPIGDEGIRSLIPYVSRTTEDFPLADLNLNNCKLSCCGVTELLDALSLANHSLASLSIADNNLGSQVGAALGKFLGSLIKSLDIRDIGLGSSGFLELKKSMRDVKNLVIINISENRGGLQTVEFLLKLITVAPQLVSVNAGYNLLPVESLEIICAALKEGKLQYLDLTGNQKLCQQDCDSALAEFQQNGKPVLQISPTSVASTAIYDDDP